MKKWLILAAVCVAALVAPAGYLVYSHLRDNKVIEGAYPSVKNTSLRVTNSLQLIESHNVTYKELFEKIDSEVAELDKRLLEVQSASTPSTEKWMHALADYIRASQEALRAEEGMARQKMMAHSAVEFADRQTERLYAERNPYGVKYLQSAAEEAVTDATNKLKEAKKAARAWDVALGKLAQARDIITPFVPADALVDPALIETYRKMAKHNAG